MGKGTDTHVDSGEQNDYVSLASEGNETRPRAPMCTTLGQGEEKGSCEAALAPDTAPCAPEPGDEALRMHSLLLGAGHVHPLSFWLVRKPKDEPT